jgi:hypothetical protein
MRNGQATLGRACTPYRPDLDKYNGSGGNTTYGDLNSAEQTVSSLKRSTIARSDSQAGILCNAQSGFLNASRACVIVQARQLWRHG